MLEWTAQRTACGAGFRSKRQCQARGQSAALAKGRPGKIVNLLDAPALRPKDQYFSYTVSKFGLDGLTKATAHALAGRNIAEY